MIHTTLAELADRFDVFLVDQFGVLLDGRSAYPGAARALSELAGCGKRVAVLSNSGKRAAPNVDRLIRMGFAQEDFETVFSSGEAAHRVLARRIGRDLPAGANVLVLSRDGDLSGIDDLDLTFSDDPTRADLVLIAGSRGEDVPLDFYRELLADPANRRVPALCTNPDRTMLTECGLVYGAGQIADLYRELGGPVDEIGKPYPLIYRMAAQGLGSPAPSTVLCIGDSPAHDIRGAHAAGFAAALVRTGIHADTPLEDLLEDAPPNDRPNYVIPAFLWAAPSL